MAVPRVPINVNVGFTDGIATEPIEIEFPALLNAPAPALPACLPEIAVTKKTEAIVSLGVTNNRKKDIHDVRMIAQSFKCEFPTWQPPSSNTSSDAEPHCRPKCPSRPAISLPSREKPGGALCWRVTGLTHRPPHASRSATISASPHQAPRPHSECATGSGRPLDLRRDCHLTMQSPNKQPQSCLDPRKFLFIGRPSLVDNAFTNCLNATLPRFRSPETIMAQPGTFRCPPRRCSVYSGVRPPRPPLHGGVDGA